MSQWQSLRRRSNFNVLLVLMVSVMLGGTAQVASADTQVDVHDPWEGMNRGIFWFNEGADRFVFEPVAKGWDFVMPDPVERSIGMFFDNASFPIHFVNDLLQSGDSVILDVLTDTSSSIGYRANSTSFTFFKFFCYGFIDTRGRI